MKSILNFDFEAKRHHVWRIIFAAVLLVTAVSASAQTCVNPPANIVSWWSGESNALDNVGPSPGILVGSPAFAPGKVGTAFVFNGTNQFVRIPDSPRLHFSNALTVEAWVNPARYNPGSGIVLGKADSVQVNQHAWYLAVGGNGVPYIYTSTNGTDGQIAAQISALSACPLSNWTHVAATYDGSTLAIYVNGVAENSTPLTGNLFPSTDDVAIGAAVGGGGDNQAVALFPGMIDEPAVYNRALAAGEIQAIYTADVAGKCALPAGVYSQPVNQTNYPGTTAVFSVDADGNPPLAYQWQFNGSNISSATASSLILTNVQPNQAGTYTVAISNASPPAVTSSNASLTVIPIPACDPDPSGMVGWWSGEGNGLDNLGMNNGSLVGPPTFSPGKVGNAFNFNGSSQFLRIPDSGSLHLSNAMTLEAWIYPTAYKPSSSVVLGKSDFSPVNRQAWFLALDNTGLPFIYTSTNGIDGQVAAQVSAISTSPLNTWTHLAATYDGANLTIYVNGVAENSTPLIGNLFPSIDDVGIGASIGGGTGGQGAAFFAGLIDEPAIYKRALSSDEILAIYASDITGKCPVPLAIGSQPTNQTAHAGASASFTVSAVGQQPITYQWYFNGTSLGGDTNSSLILNNLNVNQGGNYSVAVSGAGGAPVVSSNANLKVILVNALGNGQLLTNSQYTFTNSVNIQLTNYIANGYNFYTLDGTSPTGGSTFYTGPFQVTNNCIIQARGYSPDFQQTEVSDPVTITIVPNITLTAVTAGGGKITVAPTGPNYPSNTVVSVTATPSNGWTFLGWTGDLGGTNLSNNIVMNRSKNVLAIFGTTVGSDVGGNGSIVFDPPGSVFPYGFVLRATAVPQPGNVLVFWGDAASGTTNPLSFNITNTNSIISALFTTIGSGQAALTVVPVGHGSVSINPQATSYNLGQSVAVTATPDAGKAFLGWSGNAGGTNNPLTVLMDQSKTIFANFTTNNSLVLYPVNGPGFAQGAVLDLIGEIGTHYRLDASSDLLNWTNLYNLTNSVGTLHYIDLSATNFSRRYYHAVILP